MIYRDSYEPRTVMTTSGSVELERLRLRDAEALGFESQLLGKGVARTHALEALIITGFPRGLSVRDVEAVDGEVFGEQLVGKSIGGSARTSASATGAGVSAASTATTRLLLPGCDLSQAAP